MRTTTHKPSQLLLLLFQQLDAAEKPAPPKLPTRTCNMCKVVKPVEDFYKSSYACKPCLSESRKVKRVKL